MNFGEHVVLDRVDTSLTTGGLIGPNGAGKSTFIKILATLIKPSSGEVLLDRQNILENPRKMRELLGYLPQQVPYYPNLTVHEYLNYIAAIKGIPTTLGEQQISALLTQFHLSNTGKTKLKDFSGGMRQRVGLVATLLGDPKIIIVDEPTTGLDPMERATMRNILSELATTRIVILSTHIVSDIEAVATKLLILKAGKFIYQGTSMGLIDQVKNHVWEYVIPYLGYVTHRLFNLLDKSIFTDNYSNWGNFNSIG